MSGSLEQFENVPSPGEDISPWEKYLFAEGAVNNLYNLAAAAAPGAISSAVGTTIARKRLRRAGVPEAIINERFGHSKRLLGGALKSGLGATVGATASTGLGHIAGLPPDYFTGAEGKITTGDAATIGAYAGGLLGNYSAFKTPLRDAEKLVASMDRRRLLKKEGALASIMGGVGAYQARNRMRAAGMGEEEIDAVQPIYGGVLRGIARDLGYTALGGAAGAGIGAGLAHAGADTARDKLLAASATTAESNPMLSMILNTAGGVIPAQKLPAMEKATEYGLLGGAGAGLLAGGFASRKAEIDKANAAIAQRAMSLHHIKESQTSQPTWDAVTGPTDYRGTAPLVSGALSALAGKLLATTQEDRRKKKLIQAGISPEEAKTIVGKDWKSYVYPAVGGLAGSALGEMFYQNVIEGHFDAQGKIEHRRQLSKAFPYQLGAIGGGIGTLIGSNAEDDRIRQEIEKRVLSKRMDTFKRKVPAVKTAAWPGAIGGALSGYMGGREAKKSLARAGFSEDEVEDVVSDLGAVSRGALRGSAASLVGSLPGYFLDSKSSRDFGTVVGGGVVAPIWNLLAEQGRAQDAIDEFKRLRELTRDKTQDTKK